MTLSHLLLRRLKCSKSLPHDLFSQISNAVCSCSLSTAADSATQSPPTAKPSSLSARMSFIFEQIDVIDKKREEKDETLQRIRAWRESKKQNKGPSYEPPDREPSEDLKEELVKSEALMEKNNLKNEVELVHPWAEWIELMERLVQQNYFDHRRKDEEGMLEGFGLGITEASTEDDKGHDFIRDFKTVQTAVVNFGRDRFDILRSLSRQDLQRLSGYGCPSTDKRVVFSSKLLRKHVHLDEGDVCSSCSLRGSCEKAYLLTNKEDEPRTIDVMRVLLAYAFDPIDESGVNKPLLKMKSMKTVVRKLLHEVVKLSAVPIDPNLSPPVIKKPPPKVKQPPPTPKRRVGRSDVEMKKGDWLCPKCDFLNFAKNNMCLQCDAKRPKRQLLPGEWECPECNFLNYRRNTVCFHCENKRPPDTYTESQFSEKQHGPRMRTDKPSDRENVTNAWNFDFDDNESDGADIATFEHADSQKLDEDFHLGRQTLGGDYPRRYGDGSESRGKSFERERSDSSPMRPGPGFNDFNEDDDDDDDLDSYEVISQDEVPKTSRIHFSELEADSESDDVESNRKGRERPTRGMKQMHPKAFTNSEDVVGFDTDDDLPIHPNWKSSHVVNQKRQKRVRNASAFGSDDDEDDDDDDERFRTKNRGNARGSKYNGMRNKTGGKSSSKEDLFSETDSGDEPSYSRVKQRDTVGRGGVTATKKSYLNNDFGSGPKRNNRGGRENSNNGQAKNARSGSKSKYRSDRQGGSFSKREGKLDNFNNQTDSSMDDNKCRRPRTNVR